jgi:hypothetical protein
MTPYRVHLSQSQLQKIARCGKNKKPCKIKINLKKASNHSINLTPIQIANIENAKRLRKNGIIFQLSGSQTGGFLPLLAAAIPALTALGKAAALGSAGYLGSKLMQKIAGKGLKKGKGIYLPGKKV